MNTSGCVVITGSSKGIGFGLAQAFLNLGWCVVISARQPQQLEVAVQQLSNSYSHDQILSVICDITEPTQLQHLWDQAVLKFCKVDIWINNAGTCHAVKNFQDIEDRELIQVIQTNVLGTLLGTKTAFNAMLLQGHGQIFNMEGWGSQGEWSSGMTTYAASKRAISYFTKGIYKENKHCPVLIGSLSPGMVATDLLVDSWQNGQHANWHKMKWLYHFIIDPPEVVCRYLAQKIAANRKNNARIVWMRAWRLALRFIQPYYWFRKPVAGTKLENLK